MKGRCHYNSCVSGLRSGGEVASFPELRTAVRGPDMKEKEHEFTWTCRVWGEISQWMCQVGN